MKLIYMERRGLFPEIKSIAPITKEVVATIPVIAAIREAGGTVELLHEPRVGYLVAIGKKMPVGIVVTIGNRSRLTQLRMDYEPEYPIEYPDYWAQVDWTPCPKCGAPVVWYEAGYVPGYRVCTGRAHHHSLAK